jgi:hypothetical protein
MMMGKSRKCAGAGKSQGQNKQSTRGEKKEGEERRKQRR